MWVKRPICSWTTWPDFHFDTLLTISILDLPRDSEVNPWSHSWTRAARTSRASGSTITVCAATGECMWWVPLFGCIRNSSTVLSVGCAHRGYIYIYIYIYRACIPIDLESLSMCANRSIILLNAHQSISIIRHSVHRSIYNPSQCASIALESLTMCTDRSRIPHNVHRLESLSMCINHSRIPNNVHWSI